MIYKKDKLGNYIDILSGFAFKSKDFVKEGIPLIKIKNITPPNVSLVELSYISSKMLNNYEKYILSYDDVLIALTGSHINQWESVVGRVARVKYKEKSLLNQRVGKIFVRKNVEADLDYIYYFLSQDVVKLQLANKAGGAANQANISSLDIKNLEFPCPNVKIQRKISKILKTYDDLIENNQKQIKLLEEAAQRLYKEWFVDLRFPGYENTPIIDGVPKGWKEQTLADIADVVMGQSPKSEFYNEQKNGLPFHQGVANFATRFVDDEIYSTSFTRVAEANSILFSVRAPVGRINITKNKIVIGRGLAAINHKFGYQNYLFYLLKERFFKDNLIGNGSIFSSISKDELLAQKFMIPVDSLVKYYNHIAENIDLKIFALDTQIKVMIEARNRLLSKLMNGEIEV
jgi:restriction modification system DNA specificity domain protein